MVEQKCKTCVHWGYENQKTNWRPCTCISWALEEPEDHDEVKTLESSIKAMVFAEAPIGFENELEPVDAQLYTTADYGCNEYEEE